MPRRASKVTSYLNVDLEVGSRSELSPLIRSFGAINLFSGRTPRGHVATFEVTGLSRSPVSTLRGHIRRIRRLRGRARHLWQTAVRRDFNIGVQAGRKPHAFELVLTPATVRAVAGVHAGIVLTVYAVE